MDFLRSLIDFDFETFITMRVVKPLYIFLVVITGLGSLFFLITSLMAGPTGALIALVLVVPMALLYIIMWRVYCELIVLLFDISDRVDSLAAPPARPAAPAAPQGYVPPLPPT